MDNVPLGLNHSLSVRLHQGRGAGLRKGVRANFKLGSYLVLGFQLVKNSVRKTNFCSLDSSLVFIAQ